MAPLDEFRLRGRQRRNTMVLGSQHLRQPADPLWVIVLSLVLATALTVYPIPYDWSNWRPLWLVAVALYWVLYQPAWCGIWFAFAVGLCADLLMDLQLGGQSFALVLVVFVLRTLIQNRRVMTFWNGWVLTGVSVGAFLLLNLVMQNLMGRQLLLGYWVSGATTLLVWPLLYGGLRRWRA